MAMLPRRPRTQFSVRLEQARKNADYETAAEFARALGVEVDTYRRWERGETEPSVEHLTKIHALTSVSLDFLVAGRLPTFPKTH